jgi:hypothetical protein
VVAPAPSALPINPKIVAAKTAMPIAIRRTVDQTLQNRLIRMSNAQPWSPQSWKHGTGNHDDVVTS